MGHDVPMERINSNIDVSDLTKEEIEELDRYKEFIKSKRKNKKGEKQ